MLLDRQRPEVADVRQRPPCLRRDEEIGRVGPQPDLVPARILEGRRQIDHVWQGEEEQRQDGVVEGKDAQRAARIEVAEVARAALRVEKQTGDEEAGQDEEE